MYEWKQELDHLSLAELYDFIFEYDQYFKSEKQPLCPSEYFHTVYSGRK